MRRSPKQLAWLAVGYAGLWLEIASSFCRWSRAKYGQPERGTFPVSFRNFLRREFEALRYIPTRRFTPGVLFPLPAGAPAPKSVDAASVGHDRPGGPYDWGCDFRYRAPESDDPATR